MSLAMSRAEREAFLADVHIGLLAVAEPGRAPLVIPIWYAFAEGEVRFVTARASRKGRLLAEARRCSLCVQSESPPYKYVTIEGPVVDIAAADRERDVRPLAHRYLGSVLGDRYVDELAPAGENVLVRVRPEHWLSVDYAKEYSGA